MHCNAIMPLSSCDYMDQLLAIIDSRLQFISYKMEQFSNIDANANLGSSRSDSYIFVQQTDLTFQIIERLTRQKSRLLTIRKYVSPENIDIVYALLQEDVYLHFSTNDLRNKLLKSANHMLDNQVPRAASSC